MANIKINGNTYSGVNQIKVPAAEGEGNVIFPDVSGDSVTAGEVLEGKTFHNADGSSGTGSIPTKDASDLTVNGKTLNVPAGYYASPATKDVATGSVTPAAALSGSVLGATATDYPVVATPSATVNAGYVATAGAGAAVTRYVQVEEKTATPSGSSQQVTPSSGKLLSKVTVNPVALSGDAAAGNVLKGKTFYSNSLTKQTGTLTVPSFSLANGVLTIA